VADANGDGVANPGEVKPLSAYGIVAISCKWRTLPGHTDRIAYSPDGVTFKDGRTRATFDLILKTQSGFQAAFRATSLPGDGP
jgi:hypothetical protein